jgi:hypothetical protein
MDAYSGTGKQLGDKGSNVGRKAHGRSRVSNGNKALPDTDGRLRIARRFRDIANFILVDQGGIEQCSESRKQLIRRFAAAAVLAEQLESKLARGEEIDVAAHALLCSTLTRLASRIGIDRIPKEVLSLDQYLDQPREAAE